MIEDFKKYLQKIGVSFGEIYVLLTILALILAVPFLTISFWDMPSFNNTGVVGDTFGGLTAPLLSFFGSVLVYFALKSQIKANKIISDQFEEQNQDKLFFRLNDDLKERIKNIKYNPSVGSSKDLEGIEAFHRLVLDYKNCFHENLLSKFGSIIIDSNFDMLNSEEINNISENISPFPFYDKKEFDIEDFKMRLIQSPPSKRLYYIVENHNAHDELSSDPFSNTINLTKELKINSSSLSKTLAKIGEKYFYKVNFEERQSMYEFSYRLFKRNNFLFLSGYLNNLVYIFQTISKVENKEKVKLYQDFLYFNLAEYEKALLLFILASKVESENLTIGIKNLTSKYDFTINREYLFDYVKNDISLQEITNIINS